MPAGVIAVIVHWRDREDTLGCVRSALAQGDVQVLVVDNGSSEPIGPQLAREVPAVRVLVEPENRGYAGGANRGIREALAMGAEVVLLLNNDVRLRPDATAAALRVLADDRRVAVVGPKVLTREDPTRLWLAWGDVTYRHSLVALRGADAPDGPPYDRRRDVEWVAGCAMWMTAASLADIGLFDETFFAYHEEVDWCVRANRAGWRVVYEPAAVVSHTGRGTSGGTQSVRIRKYFAARNSILFARKHGSVFERAKLAAFLVVSLPLQLAWHGLHGRSEEVWLKVEGVRDGLRGRRPPYERLGLR